MEIDEQSNLMSNNTEDTGTLNPTISIRNLWKVYGKNPKRALSKDYGYHDKRSFQENLGLVIALQDVSLDITKGETFVVMGLSGSGKSTLVRCLIRLIEPTSGSILFDGENILAATSDRLIEFRRTKVAMVFQHYGLLPHRTVMENAAWGLEVQGIPKTERHQKTTETLNLVGLDGWEDAYPRELSGGMQQRVGLARALALNPDILLLDEPFSGLDPLIRRNMQDELLRIQREVKKTIVFITHDLSEALKLGDRIAIMRDGAVIQIGRAEDIVLQPEDEYVSEFTKDVRQESILTANHIMMAPKSCLSSETGLQDAINEMESTQSTFALIVDGDSGFLGTITLTHARTLLQSEITAPEASIASLITKGAETVSLDTTVDQLISLSMMTDQPIPVVDEHGKLRGVVPKDAVAKAITT